MPELLSTKGFRISIASNLSVSWSDSGSLFLESNLLKYPCTYNKALDRAICKIDNFSDGSVLLLALLYMKA